MVLIKQFLSEDYWQLASTFTIDWYTVHIYWTHIYIYVDIDFAIDIDFDVDIWYCYSKNNMYIYNWLSHIIS